MAVTTETPDLPDLEQTHSCWAYKLPHETSWTELPHAGCSPPRRLGAANCAVRHMRENGKFPTENTKRGFGEVITVRDLFGQEHTAWVQDIPAVDFNFTNNPHEYFISPKGEIIKLPHVKQR